VRIILASYSTTAISSATINTAVTSHFKVLELKSLNIIKINIRLMTWRENANKILSDGGEGKRSTSGSLSGPRKVKTCYGMGKHRTSE
jgi:hypothetical protein